ncbi:MAG TPA: hypothetical protein PK869_06570 [Candidatus Hydrogenedentes bacterium]|nr:hypothetical protein [Candidatus Hydrogenedentota bacterium]
MKRYLATVALGLFSVLLVPSCGPKDTSQANVPPSVASARELRQMKEQPQDYDPKALEAAGLDPSLGTPGGLTTGGEPAAGAEAAPAE